ncbi:hypothetical protein [Vulcanococcus sp.]|jgi:hypothetical protein|uniref:hypothetical protein n=1 Tax=Vulcanococcus sp. TaxID=2856995 RepID=UPI0037DA46F3
MTVPGEKNYWIADCYSDSVEDMIWARIDQMEHRLDQALPARINLLDAPDQEEAQLALLIAARYCIREALKSEVSKKALEVFSPSQLRAGFVCDRGPHELEVSINKAALLQEQRDALALYEEKLAKSGLSQGELLEVVK